MRKGIAAAAAFAVAALVALSFFLPEWLSTLRDRQLLDSPSIQAENEDREGFAESIQLSVAEKLLLLRSGTLNVMELSQGEIEGIYVNFPEGGEFTLNLSVEEDFPELKVSENSDASAYIEELSQTWKDRLEAVQAEIRSLQAMGGLPELWSDEDPLHCTGYGELLYIDPDTQMSFQVYHVTLSRESLSLHLMVDIQSGRILSFSLQWGRDDSPSWGMRGASAFGGVWRNYWRLDSVSSGWYNEYNRSILERTEEAARTDGDYTACGQISFTYDSQSLPIPLECESYRGRSFAIRWNT